MGERHRPAPGLPDRTRAFLARHVAPGSTVCAAYSGGLDSTVLLDLLWRLREALGLELSALHVHHGLSPEADRWASACEAFAGARGVALRVVRVRVDRRAGLGLEAAARAARHAAFAGVEADFLALAHHRDDQAETVLLQALRGTGVKGLAAMGEARRTPGATWLRPLLDEPREALLAWASEQGLAWVDDVSNASAAFDRNFLRHEILPRLVPRFAAHRESLARLARHAAAAQAILDEVAAEDVTRLASGESLSVTGLAALSAPRRANALRHFLASRGLPMPSAARLAEIDRQLRESGADALPAVRHGGLLLARHRDRLLLLPDRSPAQPWRVPWKGALDCDLGAHGEVRFRESVGEGIARERAAQGDWHFAPRAGGETFRLRPGGPARTLKNLLREAGVPVRERSRMPLLFDGSRLAWAPGLGVAADYRAEPAGRGLVPEWRPPGGAETASP